MSDVGIILSAPDETIQAQAKAHGYTVVLSSSPAIVFERALIVEPKAYIRWDLVPAGFDFVQKWDAAVSLWRYEALAAEIGTPSERERTVQFTLDERVLVLAPELLFVRNSPEARALLDAWHEERKYGNDNRLAFLRAYYRVKPRLCVLPCSWNGPSNTVRPPAKVWERPVQEAPVSARLLRRQQEAAKLVSVEIAPGRYVRCAPGREEELKQRLINLSKSRRERKANASRAQQNRGHQRARQGEVGQDTAQERGLYSDERGGGQGEGAIASRGEESPSGGE